MDDNAKKEIAVFRFGVIADLVGRKLNRGEKELILKEKSSSRWEYPLLHEEPHQPLHHPCVDEGLREGRKKAREPHTRREKGQGEAPGHGRRGDRGPCQSQEGPHGRLSPCPFEGGAGEGDTSGEIHGELRNHLPDLQEARGLRLRPRLSRQKKVRVRASQRHLAERCASRSEGAP